MVAFYSALSGDKDALDQDRPHLALQPAQIDPALSRLALQAGRYVVFAPGAEYGPAKRWPAGHFAELARGLEAPVILLGSAKEDSICQEIAAAAGPGKCLNLAARPRWPTRSR